MISNFISEVSETFTHVLSEYNKVIIVILTATRVYRCIVYIDINIKRRVSEVYV